jgi:hypothetical protein
MALWEEEDGSKYIALDNNEHTKFYGPLTDEQVAAYELLRNVDQEPDDWVAPEPLLDVAMLPQKVRTCRVLQVGNSLSLKREKLPRGTEVLIYGYDAPKKRSDEHTISFQLIDVPGSVNSLATADCFDLSSLIKANEQGNHHDD